MKKMVFVMFALTMLIGNVAICVADPDDFDESLIIKGDTRGNDGDLMRQMDELITGTITDNVIKFELDSSLGITDVVIKNDNNLVVKGTQVNATQSTNLTIQKSDLGTGSFTVNFITEDGSGAYTMFIIK